MLSSYITTVGNIITTPKVEYKDGIGRCKFRLAVSDRKRNKETGEWLEVGTTYYSVTVWRGLAEHVAQTLAMGDRAIVAGRFQGREWTNEADGRKGTSLEIEADVCGPDLLWRSASIRRAERSTSADGTAVDSAGQHKPAAPVDWGVTPVAADPTTGDVTNLTDLTPTEGELAVAAPF